MVVRLEDVFCVVWVGLWFVCFCWGFRVVGCEFFGFLVCVFSVFFLVLGLVLCMCGKVGLELV